MSRGRVLIVEDELVVADDIRRRLERQGWYIAGTADTADDAVRLAGELRPDLVLMDIRLHGEGDGISAAEEIRERYRLPVVYLTAHADDETIRRARTTEPFGYVLKPFEDRELHTVLEMALYKHQAERRLRDSERRYAATLNSIGDGVIATDVQGAVSFLNPVAEQLTGWSLEEARGQPLEKVFRIVNEHSRQPVENPVRRVLQEGRVVGLANATILLARDGREFPIDDRAAPICDDKGACTGAVLVFRDVSEKRRAEREKQHLEEQLRQAHKMEAIGQLAGGVAHDFNNLLTVITGYTSVLQEGFGAESPWRGMVDEIGTASQRAADLTRQLLAFSRRQMLQPKVLQLNQVVVGMEKLLRRVLPADVELIADLGQDLPAIKVDPGNMELLLLNLAANARDAMPHGGQLRLTTDRLELSEAEASQLPECRPGMHVRLRVRDTGSGMDENTRRRIFEPFFTTKEVGKGTGLGLASVYGIVKSAAGHIEVESKVGAGTTFTVLLPSVNETPTAPPRPPLPDLPRGVETILLAEDDESVRNLGCLVLRQAGYTVLEARHGVEAMELALRYTGKIDLLIADAIMPRMSGPALATLLTTEWPGLPVLFVTGFAEAERLRQSVGRATVDVLEKPFVPLALARTVRDILDRRK